MIHLNQTRPTRPLSYLVLFFTLVGLPLLVFVLQNKQSLYQFAAGTSLLETENGVLSGNVTIGNDSSASGGKYIQFGNSSTNPTPTTSANPLPIGVSGTWNLTFSDEFNETSLDTSKWNTCYWWAGPDNGCTNGGDGSINYYLPNEVSEGNGIARLTEEKKTVTGSDGKSYNYVGGMIATNRTGSQTSDKFSFIYGFMEIRTKFSTGAGMWPGFWTAASDHNWPPEIDVMEANGAVPHHISMTLHYPGGQDATNFDDQNMDYSAYHTFGVDWEPNVINWYVDGVIRKTYTNTANIPSKALDILANFAVSGVSGWSPTSSTVFPGFMDIDYIRVWKKGL